MFRQSLYIIAPILTIFLAQQLCFAQTATETDLETDTAEAVAQVDQWPQWRGVNRDGRIETERKWPNSLDEETLVELWSKTELGPSYSGPIVSDDLVFTTETVDEKTERVTAYRRSDGEPVWTQSWPGAMTVPFFAKANGDWIRSTPAFDGTHLYVAGMRDVLVCLDAASGEERWKIDFVEKFESPLPTFGFVCSPLIDGDDLYVQAGGGTCKIEKATGKVIWRSVVDEGGMSGSAFSSPVIAEIAGKKLLLVQTREALKAVDPEDGAELWSRDIKTMRGMNILTPTVWNDCVFTSAYRGKAQLFKFTNSDKTLEAREQWANAARGYMSSPVIVDDYLYLHLQNRRFTCINLKTGERPWTSPPFGKYWSMVSDGEKILALDQTGELLLIRANPEKFDVIDQRTLSDEPTWAHVAISGDTIFVRSLHGLKAYRWGAEAP